MSLKDTAINLIKKFGSNLTKIKIIETTYNVTTLENELTTETSTVYAVKDNFDRSEIDNTNILIDDIKLLIAGDTEITAKDIIEIEDKQYKIISIKKIKPANELIYQEIQVRK